MSTPKVVAFENDLYAFTGVDGTTNRGIENDLFRLIDTPIRPVLRKLADRQNVSDSELDQVAQFVGYLKVRTPTGIDEIEQAYTGVLNKTNPYLSKEYVEERKRSYERETGTELGMEADEIVAMFTSEQYELGPERGHLLVLMCETGLTISRHLRELDWTFLVAPEGRHFIVSDHPFVILPAPGHDPSLGGVGIRSEGAIKYVPLTATLCLQMGDAGTQVKYQSANGSEVRKINGWMARNSQRFLFGNSEVLLQRILSAADLKPGEHKSEVVVREIRHATDPDRALLQVFTRSKIEAERREE